METEIEDEFKLPIFYLEDKIKIEEHLINDLELIETQTQKNNHIDNNKSLYKYVFNPGNIEFANSTIPLWSKYYTANKNFIIDSQNFIKSNIPNIDINNNYDDVREIWKEIITETGFEEKYQYLDYSFFKPLNNNAGFLQCMSLYNITSPIISLALPIFFLIIPFFILQLQGIPITVAKYIEVLKNVFQKHQLGQIFNVASVSWEKRVYILITFMFYIIQVYQNVMSCIRFTTNMKKLHHQLFIIREYASETITKMDIIEECCKKLNTYKPFIEEMKSNRHILCVMRDDFNSITPNKLSLKKILQTGHLLKCFYQLYKRKPYHDALNYSFKFNGFLHNITIMKTSFNNGIISTCKLSKKKTKFTNAYFPALMDENPIKNTYNLDKQLLITGPNAAGKTTLLKTTIFNIIFSQQTGFGYYDSATIRPYDFIHSYINIPDTSGRDSLFQAEARRCKNILEEIEKCGEKTRHFCIFDELYSGTNPYEAIGSATAFLNYLNRNKNVSYMITTHFLDLCRRLDKDNSIQNTHMKIEKIGDDFKYKYIIEKGISDIKGGIKVLRDLEYPEEIINMTKKIISELNI